MAPMIIRPRCYNREPFRAYVHHGRAPDGQPLTTVIPFVMSKGCGSFRDVQKFDGTTPTPRPVFEGWACAGCRWHPDESQRKAKPAKRKRNPNSAIHIAPKGDRRPEERWALTKATGMRC